MLFKAMVVDFLVKKMRSWANSTSNVRNARKIFTMLTAIYVT